MTASTSCAFGSAPGYWTEGLQWVLHPTPACPAPLPRYLSIQPWCLRGNGKKAPSDNCTAVDHSTLRRLENASVLMFGDSTAYKLMINLCAAATGGRAHPRSFLDIPRVNRSSPYFVRLSREVHHRFEHHACQLLEPDPEASASRSGTKRPSLLLPLGFMGHYGVSGEPFWAYAYPRPPWLGTTSEAMARHDAPQFCARTGGCEPTLVVLNSAFWDIASWWLSSFKQPNRTRNGEPDTLEFHGGPHELQRYVSGVRTLVGALREAFPTATFAWRTAHPGLGNGITSTATSMVNAAARALAPELNLRLLEAGGMIEQLSPRKYLLGPPSDGNGRMRKGTKAPGKPSPTQDGRHLHPFLDIEVGNLMLAELGRAYDEQAASGVRRYPACSTTAPVMRWPPGPKEAPTPGPWTGAEPPAPPPGALCAHAVERPSRSEATMYAPVLLGDKPSGGCTRFSCDGAEPLAAASSPQNRR